MPKSLNIPSGMFGVSLGAGASATGGGRRTQHRVCVASASTCNVCLRDTTSDPLRGASYRWDRSGGSPELFAPEDRTHQGIQAHPAPRGLTFFDNGELSGASGRARPHRSHHPAAAGRRAAQRDSPRASLST